MERFRKDWPSPLLVLLLAVCLLLLRLLPTWRLNRSGEASGSSKRETLSPC